MWKNPSTLGWQPAGTSRPDHNHLREIFNVWRQLYRPQWLLALGTNGSTVFPSANFSRITNAGRVPVVIFAGCSTAHCAAAAVWCLHGRGRREHAGSTITKSSPRRHRRPRRVSTRPIESLPGFGEQLLKRGPNGAVAHIGCTTGSQPALTLVHPFCHPLSCSPLPRLSARLLLCSTPSAFISSTNTSPR